MAEIGALGFCHRGGTSGHSVGVGGSLKKGGSGKASRSIEEIKLVFELKTPELEQKLIARIRQFDFGAKDVDVMVVSWPVDFLPS